MKRAAIAVACLAGATIPATIATVYLFGCCVLPFHRTLHRLMPLCSMAMHQTSSDDHRTSTPASERQQVKPRFVSAPASKEHLQVSIVMSGLPRTGSALAYRSFISLGATRCDRDVGLRLQLLDTLRV
ncbi:MAG TPA: hypothetical protein VGS96_07140 [Thermoanaerobaculia bacterium]|jgi:hypothetical protein|nr:hypothetical protein [Thermoanaerobaculia bacterium]